MPVCRELHWHTKVPACRPVSTVSPQCATDVGLDGSQARVDQDLARAKKLYSGAQNTAKYQP